MGPLSAAISTDRRLQNALAQSNNWLDSAVLKRSLKRAGKFVRKVSVDLPKATGGDFPLGRPQPLRTKEMGRNHRVQARHRANELTAGARRTNVIDEIGNEIAGIRDILGVPFRWPICEDGSRRAESQCPREAQETEVLTVTRGELRRACGWAGARRGRLARARGSQLQQENEVTP